jgi:mono/diheme cytochrome c family protein
MTNVARRGYGLVTVIMVAIVLMACGRASDEQIDQALGITPTATVDATLTANQTATADAAASSAGSPVAGGAAPVAATGNPVLGKSKASFTCAVCHRVGGGGTAGDLLDPSGAAAGMTFDDFTMLIREGMDHPPGAYETFEVTDADIANIYAYIQEEAAP